MSVQKFRDSTSDEDTQQRSHMPLSASAHADDRSLAQTEFSDFQMASKDDTFERPIKSIPNVTS
jgi:hypothetical protein